MAEPAEVRIKVENFYGPLDLLLHLVKQSEVDVTRVSLAEVAGQYITFIEAMQKLDIDLAGEFLTTASQLLLIKSRTLMPADAELEEEEEEEEDTSLELIRRLLEYKIYKDRARTLGRMLDQQSLKVSRPRMKLDDESRDEPLRDMAVWDLVVLWARMAKAIRLDGSIDILYQTIPIEVFINKILASVQNGRKISFQALLGDKPDKRSVIGTFLAMLELMKEQRVDAEESDGDILIREQATSIPPETPAHPPADGV